MQHELRRLSELSAKLKEEKEFYEELNENKRKAIKRGADVYELLSLRKSISDSDDRIASLKNMIMEHVHILAGLYDAQPPAE